MQKVRMVKSFNHLMEIIESEENIKLAYQNNQRRTQEVILREWTRGR